MLAADDVMLFEFASSQFSQELKNAITKKKTFLPHSWLVTIQNIVQNSYPRVASH